MFISKSMRGNFKRIFRLIVLAINLLRSVHYDRMYMNIFTLINLILFLMACFLPNCSILCWKEVFDRSDSSVTFFLFLTSTFHIFVFVICNRTHGYELSIRSIKIANHAQFAKLRPGAQIIRTKRKEKT